MLSLFVRIIDIALVLVLIYLMLVVIGERRNLWMIRGLIVLMLAAVVSHALKLSLLGFVLTNLSFGAAVAMAFMLQAEIRRFLEILGRGELGQLFSPSNKPVSRPDSVIDELVDAVRELSQKRTGALMILETGPPIDENDFSVPGVRLNAELSKELIQTIFQTSTLLHDGAVLIRASRIIAAGVILPISERIASRQLGTRHRAAMGITERIENCLCIVVSEETGSISIAQRGRLNRPLTSNRLRELLQEQFSESVESDTVSPELLNLSRRLTGLWKRTRQLVKR
ncbi:TIGR00159 family protein [Leptolyngbya cf. ectocarpi LEGE 11479]|uniref:Diadenylate cyclase n=1 Tax=Leptolyngbya cf. ectocarpi LEGE 11479 TaxID=1828722 RepID=A0A929FBG3_LEPEC|nr:diadenylate cyclase CdaA [Leptolyngbya ectocarpi]MBE9068964.1 TIGR00159 family protein [Leptolyngbya cf. ectocarpi LEGE 11479]